MTSMEVPFDALVCKACRSDITRVLKDDSYIPRWQKFADQTVSGKCCVVQCHENAIYSNIGMHCDLPTFFSEASLLCKFNSIPTPTPLCRHHYNIVYKVYQPIQRNCSTCNMSLKHTQSRPCPEPDVITRLLKTLIMTLGKMIRCVTTAIRLTFYYFKAIIQ